MKLSDAIHKMNNGDFFKTKLDNWFLLKGTFFYHYDPVLEKQKGSANLCIDTLNLEGEIIRAEPEVLTAEEIIRKNDDKIYTRCELVDLGIETGQNKEHKRLKPLIENAKKYFIDGNRTKYEEIQGALMNLTPPWEPEK